jgi:hypothetical protein
MGTMRHTFARALGSILLPGIILGVIVGMVVALLDGGAFIAWAMFLGALAGAASSAGGIAVGALVMFLLRNASGQRRRLGTAIGVGLGAGVTFLLLATRVHLVAPWYTVGTLLVLVVAGSWAYLAYPARTTKIDVPA